MEKFGEFTENIVSLEDSMETVMSVWNDQTALTYIALNENVKQFAMQITLHHENIVDGYNMLKANYKESEIENELNILAAKVEAV